MHSTLSSRILFNLRSAVGSGSTSHITSLPTFRAAHPALSSLTSASEIDEPLIDSVLKDLCLALLEADVNVKLVAQLRQKVKAKAKAAFESDANKGKEANRKNVVHKVRSAQPFASTTSIRSK